MRAFFLLAVGFWRSAIGSGRRVPGTVPIWNDYPAIPPIQRLWLNAERRMLIALRLLRSRVDELFC